MSDARILHRKAGLSEKVTGLSDFDYRIWTAYITLADDFGVMPAVAAALQAGNVRLRKERSPKTVQAGLERVIVACLVREFTHQRERFVWQPDWQTWQQIRYPRDTVNPAPPADDLRTYADAKTLDLFTNHKAIKQIDFGEKEKSFQQPAGAGGRETLTPNTDSHPHPHPNGAPKWGHGNPHRGSGLVGSHTRCYDAPEACARGICLPSFLGAQWAQQVALDTDDPQRAVREFAHGIVRQLPPGPIGDDPLKFWRGWWAERHGLQAPTISAHKSAGAHALASAKTVLDLMEQSDRRLKP